jgi:hypothetical protein
MSTYQTVADQIKFLTGQDNLSSADTLRVINFAIDSYSDLAMKSDGRWKFDPHTTITHPIATADLVANQTAYEIDTNFLQIDRVEVLVDGDWKPLESIDRRDDRLASLSTTFETAGDPRYYDYDGASLFLYPASDTSTTSGLKVFYTRPVDYITALSETVGIPRIHMSYLALHGALQVSMKTNDQNRVSLNNLLIEEERKVKDYFTTRDEDRPRRIRPLTDSTFNLRSF